MWAILIDRAGPTKIRDERRVELGIDARLLLKSSGMSFAGPGSLSRRDVRLNARAIAFSGLATLAKSAGKTRTAIARGMHPGHYDTNANVLFVFGGAIWPSVFSPEAQQSLNLFPPGPDCTLCGPEQQTRAHNKKWERIV